MLFFLRQSLYIHHHLVCQVWDWAWFGPNMLLQVRLGNIVNMAFFIAWFGRLVVPHEWVVLCLLMGDVVHPLVKNVLLPLYWVFLFYFHVMGSDEWCCLHKILLIYRSYFYSLFHKISFTLLSIFIWCATSNYVCLGGCFLVTLYPMCKILACMDVYDLVLMVPAIYLWVQFLYILIPPYFYFLLKCFSFIIHVYYLIPDRDCNGFC